MLKWFTILFLIILTQASDSQTTKDYAVLVTASVDTLTPSVTLYWNTDDSATGYTVYRKSKNDISWGNGLATFPASTLQYTDTKIVIDSAYEYRVSRTRHDTIKPEGYIYVSVKLHPTEYRGKIILIVDSTYRSYLSSELIRLKTDLIGDGWTVIRHDVSPTDSVSFIRNLIKADYNADPINVKSLFLFGHVPVPYSGDINPDGHPDHLGAWPADGIYADVNGIYTDTSLVDTVAGSTRNWNKIGDGKYDQSFLSGDVKLESGRVDLSNLPSFSLSEQDLLKQYLDKDHAFRQKQFVARRRGFISDNFGTFYDEAFASCGYRDFAPMFGDTAITDFGSYFPTLQSGDYLWSYACGGGSTTSASGVGSTSDFAADTVKSVFTMLFGSWFGDWDQTDDFMRAPLASANMALSCSWSGRPYWHYHFMASGETLGFCAKWAQNNLTTYDYDYGAQFIHIALMGDPTLTEFEVAPVANVQHKLLFNNTHVFLHWNPSTDNIRGYYVYRSSTFDGPYTRIASSLVTDTSYLDSKPLIGANYYMVRAEKLENTFSGYYFNLSEGVFDSIPGVVSGIQTVMPNDIEIYPNPADKQLIVDGKWIVEKIEITNVFGQTITPKSPKGDLPQPKTKMTIDVSSLPSGIYFITITSPAQVMTKKFIISR